MAAAIANRRRTGRDQHRYRQVNTCFGWKRERHLLPLTVGAFVLLVLMAAILGLAWWYAP